MQASNLSSFTHSRARFNRAVMALVLLLLSLQFLATPFHAHAYTDPSSDCAACSFVQDLPPGVPPVATPLLPELAVPSATFSFNAYVFLAQQSYLTPPSQAPPARILIA